MFRYSGLVLFMIRMAWCGASAEAASSIASSAGCPSARMPKRSSASARSFNPADRSRIPDRIVFEGAVNQDRIRTFYSAASAFALPSFAEGIPVVLMEAMAMGIPCVSTRIAGIPELIRDGVDGLLVAASDVDELTDALARLMDAPELRRKLAESGRQRVLAHYDLDRNVAQLAHVFAARISL